MLFIPEVSDVKALHVPFHLNSAGWAEVRALP